MSYEGKHRDNSPEAITRGLEIDHDYAWSPICPCKRYHGTHTAFKCKVRAHKAVAA
jgi:hypothetical protein